MECAWRLEQDAAAFHRRQVPIYVRQLDLHLEWVTAFLVVLNSEGMDQSVAKMLLLLSSVHLFQPSFCLENRCQDKRWYSFQIKDISSGVFLFAERRHQALVRIR
jgi:hypothetical protein